MADNVTRGDTTNEDVAVATLEATFSGDTAHIQANALVGATNSKKS